MAVDIAFYKVVKEIAIRSGLIEERYRTKDNHYILDNKDLSRVRFTTDEYINGLSGVERIPDNEVETLIAEGGYKFGYDDLIEDKETNIESQEQEEVVNEEQSNEENVEANDEAETGNKESVVEDVEEESKVDESQENHDEEPQNIDEAQESEEAVETNENQEEE